MTEIYDHLQGKETLIIYMTKEGEKSITLSGGMLTQSHSTRILQDSYDYRPVEKRMVRIGERLTCGAVSGHDRIILPTDWVVTEVESYEPIEDIPCFREVTIAYCERQPLSLEDFKDFVYDVTPKVSPDSFGGDLEAYENYQRSQSPELTKV